MLTTAEDHIKSINPKAEVYLFGQELNAESWAVCESDMLMRNQRGQHRPRQLVQRRRLRRPEVRLHAGQPAVRRGVEEGQGRGRGRGRARLRGPLRRGPAAHQRRLVPVPAAHDLEDGAGRGQGRAAGDRLQRLAAVHRRGRVRRVARSAAGSSRTTGSRASSRCPDQLFYNTGISTYFWILSNRKAPGAARQGHPARRPRPVGEDAQVPRRQAQADQRRPDRAHHRALRGRPRRSRRTPSIRTTGR